MCFNQAAAKWLDPAGDLVRQLQDKALGQNNPLDAFASLGGTSAAYKNYKDNQKPDAPINYSGTPASSSSSRVSGVDPQTGLPIADARSLSIPTSSSSSATALTSNPGLNIPT